MANVVAKNKSGYGFKYTDLAQINKFIVEDLEETYYQEIETDSNGNDYVVTIRQKQGRDDIRIRGCRVTDAVLSGSGAKNPVQMYGAGLTYCRRYSLLMAYGLATEDNDAADFVQPVAKPKQKAPEADNAPMTEAHQEELILLLDENRLKAMDLFGMQVYEMPDRYYSRAKSKIMETIGK